MSKLKKTYTKAEKLEIVSQSLEESESVKAIAERFELSENTIYRWRKAYLKNQAGSLAGKENKVMTDSERKIKDLEKELRELKLERDILKKAVGIFSKSDGKYSNL